MREGGREGIIALAAVNLVRRVCVCVCVRARARACVRSTGVSACTCAYVLVNAHVLWREKVKEGGGGREGGREGGAREKPLPNPATDGEGGT